MWYEIKVNAFFSYSRHSHASSDIFACARERLSALMALKEHKGVQYLIPNNPQTQIHRFQTQAAWWCDDDDDYYVGLAFLMNSQEYKPKLSTTLGDCHDS